MMTTDKTLAWMKDSSNRVLQLATGALFVAVGGISFAATQIGGYTVPDQVTTTTPITAAWANDIQTGMEAMATDLKILKAEPRQKNTAILTGDDVKILGHMVEGSLENAKQICSDAGYNYSIAYDVTKFYATGGAECTQALKMKTLAVGTKSFVVIGDREKLRTVKWQDWASSPSNPCEYMDTQYGNTHAAYLPIITDIQCSM